jgi:hypothetical protein
LGDPAGSNATAGLALRERILTINICYYVILLLSLSTFV